MSLAASPTKLRDGSWGARVRGDVATGATVRITTAAGKSWDATVSRVVWRGDGITIVATAQTSRAERDPKAPGGAEYDGGRRGAHECYMCGSRWCDGARGGLCDDD